ncbi:cadherin-like beta sandwich domain-containing protein [Flavobacterium sp. ENC]|uniref:T9SS type A sorting domain-containing protein n=1 Tax=Flavobacterium sp. ENC TaxID=2897330 RepID=UPI001E3AA134|nr:cadherin-like beta sandwich domain-containing protein [Flavobacterium sp. ENC]MCD0466673.1 cadherin-like beta sandwich domain-containing protein [Flavobacterium sp. ENC]
MNRTFTFLFSKKPFWVVVIAFLSVFQTMAAQETPTRQASNLVFTNTTATTTTISWQYGGGNYTAVFMRKGTNPNPNPAPEDNVNYKPNTIFGLGDQVGTAGWYCVADTWRNMVVVTGLTPGTTYQVQAMTNSSSHGKGTFYLTTTSTGNPAAVTTLSDVATLSNLSVSDGTLDPVFNSATTSYQITVPNATSSITISPVASSDKATIKVNNITVASRSASQVVDLKLGTNVITTTVTAEDGTEKTYTVTITRLALPAPVLQASAVFFTNTTATSTTVNWTNGNGGGRIVFMREGTKEDNPLPENIYFNDGKVFGMGDQIGSSGWYAIVKINTDNKVEVTGLTPGTTYQVAVMEFNGLPHNPSYLTTASTGNPATVTTLSNVATLSNLTLSDGVLDTVFSPETTDYVARVPNGVSSIKVTPVTTDSNAGIKVNGVTVASGNPSQEISNLVVGYVPNLITIEVTAQSGAVKTYNIKVYRLLPSPTIQAANLTFINTTATSTTVNWTNGDGNGRIVFMRKGTTANSPVPDNIYFKEDKNFGMGDQIGSSGWYTIVKINTDNKIEITGLTPGTSYQVIVMEFGGDPNLPSYLSTTNTGNPATVTTLSNLATLSSLTLSAGKLDPVFSSETTDYVAKVPNAVSIIDITPIATDITAAIKVNGEIVSSGKVWQWGDLGDSASNNVIVTVTAQDGTEKTYTLTIERDKSLAVTENKLESFSVYPNPVKEGTIFVQTQSASSKDIKIFDILGKCVLSVQTQSKELNVEGLQKGVYILKVNQDGKSATKKMIIE